MRKRLVTCFSASGKTRKIAKIIADLEGVDFYEIKPEVVYTEEDLDWMNKKSRSSIEMNDKTFRPKLRDKDAKIETYDEILLGFPIWWYVAPTIINSFLETYDFTGKKIILFASSGGSGFGNTVRELMPSAKGAEIVEGKILTHANKKEIENWVMSL